MNRTKVPSSAQKITKQSKQAQWLQDNAESIHSSNKFINQHGLPLAQYRLF